MDPLVGIDGIWSGRTNLLAIDKGKGFCGKLGKPGISGNGFGQDGENQGVGKGECQSVELFTANDEYFAFIRTSGNSFFQRIAHFSSRSLKRTLSAQDNITPAGERVADGLPGLSPHDQGVSHGYFFETALFAGNIPRDGIISADDPVGSHGGNEDDLSIVVHNVPFVMQEITVDSLFSIAVHQGYNLEPLYTVSKQISTRGTVAGSERKAWCGTVKRCTAVSERYGSMAVPDFRCRSSSVSVHQE